MHGGLNKKNVNKYPQIFTKIKEKIETLFSQLCDPFRIRINYNYTVEDFKTRISAKIRALTLVQYINKFIFDRPINNLITPNGF